jgi:hypothetical protein
MQETAATNRHSRSRAWLCGVSGVAWIAALTIGMMKLVRYESTPGAASAAAARWVGAPQLALDASRDTLIMFVHPRCPCSRASLEELARLMTVRGEHVRTFVLFFKPINASADWSSTDLWEQANSIPGVNVVPDEGGTLAERFDARTSGQAFLYDPAGRLIFSGGITAARGHAGDNDALDAVLALTDSSPSLKEIASTPIRKNVFGCEIFPTTQRINPTEAKP